MMFNERRLDIGDIVDENVITITITSTIAAAGHRLNSPNIVIIYKYVYIYMIA